MSRIASLAAMMIRPRATIRGILDSRDRFVIPLVLLAICSSLLGEFDQSGFREALSGVGAGWKLAVIAGVLLGVTLVMLLVFWAFCWLVFLIARLLEGNTDVTAVRAALAWGLAPHIWALFYRLPAAIFITRGRSSQVTFPDGKFRFDPATLADGCAMTAGLAFAELTVLVWTVVVASLALAEAARFSGGRAFGTLALAAVAPLVILLAAVLAIAL